MEIKQLEAFDRKGTGSAKWDELKELFHDEELISMWVADMDFHCPEAVRDALEKVVSYNLYGYYCPSESYYEAFIDWEKQRHGHDVDRQWIRYSAGVVAGISWVINIMTQKQDACIILSPCYYPFMDTIIQNDRRLVCCYLKEDGGYYSIDFERFEALILENDVKMFLLCSPHNPVGRVWTREELTRLMEICRKHNVFVISDEIHHDIIAPGHRHIPTASVGDYDDMLITFTSASKTFNLAGVQNSIAIIPDEKNRKRYDAFTNALQVADGSMFGYVAVEAAYRGGREWLDTILAAIWDNYRFCCDYLREHAPGITISPLEGTYLMWADLGAYVKSEELEEFMTQKAGLAVDYGHQFFAEGHTGDTHVRFNLATPRSYVEKAMAQLTAAIERREN